MVRRLIGLASMALLASGLSVAAGVSPASASITVFPVPTSAAGLGRITTAPDGNMWFAETGEGVNQVGRITTDGSIAEFSLPEPPDGWETGDPSDVVDLDVAPDSTIWVVYDSGWQAVHLASSGNVIGGPVSLGAYPYGKAIRVAADGTPWITMSYDEDGIARIVAGQMSWDDNAPPCDGALGRAKDGSMWCQDFGDVIHVNGDAAGGTTYPLPADVSYPYHLAPGPVGSIWLALNSGGTIFTSPSSGNIGYLDQNTGQYTGFDTGSRTAPGDLVQGPDGNMWFVNVGADHAIGHISRAGVGGIHTVGNYGPSSLTFSQDGAIWFTDRGANSIVRVLPSDLQGTDIDPGSGSVFTQGPPPQNQAGAVKGVGHTVKIEHGKVALKIQCSKTAAKCAGHLTLSSKGKHTKPVIKKKAYTIEAGASHSFKLTLTKKGKHLVRSGHTTKLTLKLYKSGTKRADVVRTIKVRR